jgi:hypothetical protein
VTDLVLATGDRFGRIDDAERAGEIAWSLEGSGPASIAVDPADPDTIYVGQELIIPPPEP